MWLHPVSVKKNVQTYISPKLCLTPEIKPKYFRTGECVGIGQTTVFFINIWKKVSELVSYSVKRSINFTGTFSLSVKKGVIWSFFYLVCSPFIIAGVSGVPKMVLQTQRDSGGQSVKGGPSCWVS